MVRDIVCGMGVVEDEIGTFSTSHQGKKFYFCSVECLLLFRQDPELYMKEEKEKKIARDLVCGMHVDEQHPPFTFQYRGKVYYFYSQTCKSEFVRDPQKYIRAKASSS